MSGPIKDQGEDRGGKRSRSQEQYVTRKVSSDESVNKMKVYLLNKCFCYAYGIS